MKKLILTASVLIAAAALSGCSSSPSDTATTPPPTTTTPPAPTSFQSMFGASFLAFFNANPNTDPAVPTTADVPALNVTANAISN